MGERMLPEGMTWEDCRTCRGLAIVSPTGSAYGGSVVCCFECMKKASEDAKRERDVMRLGVRDIGVCVAEFGEHNPAYALQRVAERVNELDPINCRGCGKPLDPSIGRVADGCACNAPRGVNHGLVPTNICTCSVCDPAQTGSARDSDTSLFLIETLSAGGVWGAFTVEPFESRAAADAHLAIIRQYLKSRGLEPERARVHELTEKEQLEARIEAGLRTLSKDAEKRILREFVTMQLLR